LHDQFHTGQSRITVPFLDAQVPDSLLPSGCFVDSLDRTCRDEIRDQRNMVGSSQITTNLLLQQRAIRQETSRETQHAVTRCG